MDFVYDKIFYYIKCNGRIAQRICTFLSNKERDNVVSKYCPLTAVSSSSQIQTLTHDILFTYTTPVLAFLHTDRHANALYLQTLIFHTQNSVSKTLENHLKNKQFTLLLFGRPANKYPCQPTHNGKKNTHKGPQISTLKTKRKAKKERSMRQ